LRDAIRGRGNLIENIVQMLNCNRPCRNSPRETIDRYFSVSNRAIIFFTSEDNQLREYISDHWTSWHEKSANHLDIYNYNLQLLRNDYRRSGTFSADYLMKLVEIEGLTATTLEDCGFPCIFIWSDYASVAVPLADVTGSSEGIKERFEQILGVMRRGALEMDGVDYLSNLPFGAAYDSIKIAGNELPLEENRRVFLSYSRRDRGILYQISSRLERLNIPYWFDQGIAHGENFRTRILAEIMGSRLLLPIWTPASIKSPWVIAEVATALRRQKRLFPVSTVEESRIPNPYRGINTFHLENSNAGFDQLLMHIQCAIAE
jgi:hypothetical protein